MPRRTSGGEQQAGRGRKKPAPAAKPAARRVTIKNPINPDASSWEVELTGISERDFLDLWARDDDRLGFNTAERAIYIKSQVIGRIVKEIKHPGANVLEEEE